MPLGSAFSRRSQNAQLSLSFWLWSCSRKHMRSMTFSQGLVQAPSTAVPTQHSLLAVLLLGDCRPNSVAANEKSALTDPYVNVRI